MPVVFGCGNCDVAWGKIKEFLWHLKPRFRAAKAEAANDDIPFVYI